MKFSKYNFVETISEGLIVFNPKVSSFIKLTKSPVIEHFLELQKQIELDSSDELVAYLYKLGYVVENDKDEYAEARTMIESRCDKSAKYFTVLLYVTEQCNFRCIYCPEDHVNKRFSDENWEALYKHIEKNIKEGLYDFVRISFFGGEPLLEIKSILKFLERLQILKSEYPTVEFKHDMTTNGYLLTPDIYDKLTEYNVRHYQITLDGFSDVHDKTRPRVDGAGTWNKIIENLKYINSKDDEVSINYRANISPMNQDTIQDFMDWSMHTFDNKKFTFSTETVVANTDNVPEELTVDYQSQEYQAIDTYMNHSDRGFTQKGIKPLKLLGFSCRYAQKNYYTITTDGHISKCGEAAFGLTETVGKLLPSGDFEFFDNYKDWAEGFEIEACKDCEIYPLCAGRRCLYKKVHSQGSDRLDCIFMQEYKSVIGKYLREGMLG